MITRTTLWETVFSVRHIVVTAQFWVIGPENIGKISILNTLIDLNSEKLFPALGLGNQ